MSVQRTNFELAAKRKSWDAAADQLNGLAMFEMLPSLAGLGAARGEATVKIEGILRARGWMGSAERIKWASEAVGQRRLPSWQPGNLPPDQIADAKRFLAPAIAAAAPAATPAASPARLVVIAAVRSGQISGNGAAELLEIERNGVIKSTRTGSTASISPLVYKLLEGLVQGGKTLTLMNIVRPDERPTSPHGRGPVGAQRTSFACDITEYDGNRILLRPDDESLVGPTIRAVSGLLSRLPQGTYKFGLPRPSIRLGGPVFPAADVFLPAATMADVEHPPFGKFGKTAIPLIVRPDALAAVNAALNGNPQAQFSMFFPDAFNHAHIEIISSP